jgi:hypothetical protein
MNQLVKTTTALSPMIQELEAELARFRKVAAENSTTSFGRIFRFVKGEWVTADQEKERIPDKTRWIAVMPETQHGWCKWETVLFDDNGSTKKLPRYIVGRINDVSFVSPMRKELDDNDPAKWEIGLNGKPEDPWKQVGILPLVSVASETPMSFITDTKTGVPRFWKLIDEYGRQGSRHPGQLPIIENCASSYTDKQYGKVPIPTFPIVGWAGQPAAPLVADHAPASRVGGPGKPPPAASDLNDEIPF